MGRDSGGRGGREALMARCASRADDELRWFRKCLRWIGMDHSTACHAVVSWFFFLLLAVAVPAASHFVLTYRPRRRPYDAVVQLSLSAASALSFLSLAAGTRRIGLRRFLFLHRLHYKTDRVRSHYSAQLARSFRLLAALALPCFALEAAYKAWWYAVGAGEGRIPFVGGFSVLGDALACLLELASWAYRAAVFLLACVLFRLICHLQILRLQDFAAALLAEHLDVRRQLRVISHRFRSFIVACLLLVTASQFASVLLTTRKDSQDDLFNTAELALCSIVLVTGLLICLRSAAKITHQAQALTGLAAKWHVCATTEFSDFDLEAPSSDAAPKTYRVYPASDSEDESSSSYDGTGDEDALENTKIVKPLARTISFQNRQALVTYLENNKAGITVFGFTLDRSWLHTIFTLEWTLFLWLLSKTIGIS
ncbi:uncharacterized protein LOC109718964 [Ananas comosus]|uniref:Uncharacterized protein LOC109718964 n=1 Tax=Ananas comosus TaxID=4615 RepID=A0A6P5FZR7_ANACO|nr:uncharacterized protein LOC109718964 [Ananas comosus]